MKYKTLDVVVLDRDLPNESLRRGDLGAVVETFEPDGLAVSEFDGFGATARTLRAFIASRQELVRLVTDALIPDPDKRPGA